MSKNLIKFVLASAAGLFCSTWVHAAPLPLSGPIYNPATGHSYILLQSNLWGASESEAQVLGGHLVTINDAAENSWVSGTFANYGGTTRDLWLGLSFNGSSYVWANNEAFSYSNWEPGQPDNPGLENYVHMFGGSNPPHLPGWVPDAWNNIANVSGYILNGSQNVERDIFGVVEVVPEPSTVSLLIVTGIGLLQRGRSRAKV